MATRTISNAGGSWNTTGAWVEGAVPLASDDVVATATSGPLTVTAASVCRSMILTGYTNTISGSGAISIGDGSGGACTLAGTISGTWTTSFVSTSTNGGAGWGITSNGKSFPGAVSIGVGASGGGKWVLQDALSVTGALSFLSSGTFDWNGKSISATTLSLNGTGTRTLTPGASSVTLTAGGANVVNTRFSGLTITANASTVTLSGAAANFAISTAAGDFNGMSIVISGSGNCTLTGVGGWTCANLTRTGTAAKTDQLSIASDFTVTGTITWQGNTTQGVNRLLVSSSVRGTQRTVTCTGAAVVISGDVDFMDIAHTGSPSWTNAGSAYVGDCGGNGTLITTNRTSPVTTAYTSTASDSWSTAARWSVRVPLPQDTVTVAAITAGTLTVDMPRIGGSIDFTGTTRSVTISGNEMYGSLVAASGMTWTGTASILTLAGRGSHGITSNGKTFAMPLLLNGPGGTYTLQDAFTNSRSSTGVLTVTSGTLNDGGQSVSLTGTASTLLVNGGTLTITGSWSLSTTGVTTFWNVTSGTVNGTGSTITLTATTASTRTFAGGGQTYGTLTYTVAGSTGQLTVTGSNTFDTINFSDVTNARTLALTAGTTTTITTANGFNVQGTAGKVMSIASTSAGSAFTLTKTVGTPMLVDYVSVTDSTATGGLWVDGPHYTNGGGNTGWTFADVLPSDTDTGTGTDVDSGLSITDTDTGSGGDVDSGVSATFSDTDTGSGADAESLAATATDTDTATAVDAESNAAAINDTDTGTTIDLEVGISISDTEAGAGVDDEALSLDDTEAGSGADLDLGIAVTDDEVAAADDSGTIEATINDVETANGVDTESLTALIADLETAFVDDDGLAIVIIDSSDTGIGVDTESVFNTADPAVIEPTSATLVTQGATSATLVTQGTTTGALLVEATAGALLT